MGELLLFFLCLLLCVALYMIYKLGYRKGARMVLNEWERTLYEEDTNE